MSGDDNLARGVFDGNGHGMTFTVAETAQRLRLLPREAEDGRHGAFAQGNGLLMELRPPMDEGENIAQVDGAGCMQGRVLPETVTRHDEGFRLHTSGKGPPGRQLRREDRDLRVHREIEELLRSRETKRDHVSADDVSGFGEQIPHTLMAPVKILTHTGVLRALSRKDKTESTHGYFPVRRFRRLFQSGQFPCPYRCRNSGRHGGEAWAHGIADMRMT